MMGEQSLRIRHCHCGPVIVIADSIRNPVVAQHWIPDQVRDDSLGVQDDSLGVRDDSCRVRDDNLLARDDDH